MATTYFTARGCVYTVKGKGGGKGWYALEPEIKSAADQPVLLMSVNTLDGDLVSPVSTLDNTRILHSFGAAWGSININGMILLGESGGQPQGVSRVIEWFEANRVSKRKSAVSVSMPGGKAYKMFVTGLGISEADPQFNLQMFVVRGHMLPGTK